MKIIMYGTMLCEDCENAVAKFKEESIDIEFRDFNEKIENIKEFMRLRDKLPVFDIVKEGGYIGIPCFLLEDGSVTLDLDVVIRLAGK